jgi:hypothetical protein
VELSFDGRFELTDDDADILIRLSGGAVLWQKERLLNLAVKALPSDAGEIAWLDCDVMLKRSDWVDEAKTQLNEFNVIQLFSDAVHINSEDCEKDSAHCNGAAAVPGIASLSNSRDLIAIGSHLTKPETYKAGFAWAANKKLIEDHGFYDAAIVGGGDTLMVAAMYGQFEAVMERCRFNEARREHFLKWAIPFHKSVAEGVGHVSGKIFHLKHGKINNRGYIERQRQLAAFDFDPDLDLKIGPNGAWHWAQPRTDLEDFLRKYFISRAEDE